MRLTPLDAVSWLGQFFSSNFFVLRTLTTIPLKQIGKFLGKLEWFLLKYFHFKRNTQKTVSNAGGLSTIVALARERFHASRQWSLVTVDARSVLLVREHMLEDVNATVWSLGQWSYSRCRSPDNALDWRMAAVCSTDHRPSNQTVTIKRSRLRSCVRGRGGHFEHRLWLDFVVWSCVIVCGRVLWCLTSCPCWKLFFFGALFKMPIFLSKSLWFL